MLSFLSSTYDWEGIILWQRLRMIIEENGNSPTCQVSKGWRLLLILARWLWRIIMASADSEPDQPALLVCGTTQIVRESLFLLVTDVCDLFLMPLKYCELHSCQASCTSVLSLLLYEASSQSTCLTTKRRIGTNRP